MQKSPCTTHPFTASISISEGYSCALKALSACKQLKNYKDVFHCSLNVRGFKDESKAATWRGNASTRKDKEQNKDVTSEISERLKDGKLARRRTTTCSETDSSIHLASKQLFPFQGLIANCKDKSGKTLFLAQVHSHPLAVCFVETLSFRLPILGFVRQME